jgi:membrane-associated PAP2 superfamily phosphatase
LSTEPTSARRVARWRLGAEVMLATAVPFLASVAMLWALATNDLDERIVATYFDESTALWPFRGEGSAADYMHHWGRDVVFVIGAASLLIGCMGGLSPRLRALRRQALYLALAIGLSTGLVAILKANSPDPAPWDATIFGGTIEHLGFFQSIAHGDRMGRNSPGAHSSGAFALMALYYCWHRTSPRRAWIALGSGWFLGQAFGAVQVVRGAHFPSHNQWSCIVTWTVCTLLFWVGFGGRLTSDDPHSSSDSTELR